METNDWVYMTKFVDKERPPKHGEGLRLAICQCTSDLGEVEANIEKLIFAVKEAKALNSQLISFSELYLQGYNPTREICHETATERGDAVMSRIAKIAAENKIAILCPYAEKQVTRDTATDKVTQAYYDAMVLYGPDGKELLNYRKTHLWGPYERELYDFGYVGESDPFSVCEVNGFRVGVLNCYEAEFPELSRILALKGAQLILIPTAADHWQSFDNPKYPPNKGLPYPDVSNTVIPTRAFENGVFCSYVNHFGSEYLNGEKRAEYLGNSIIVDPLGNPMLKAPDQNALLVADLNPADFRASHPTGTNNIVNRRVDLYGYLLARVIDYIDPATGEPCRYPDKPK